MDLETISINKDKGVILKPYLLCWYDGKRDKSYSYFIIGENNGFKNIIYQIMKDICIRKYKGYKIYIHNFSKFDAIFLIKYLTKIGECEPIIHKGKIISFSFEPNWKKDFGRITFLDSFLLLPSSLKSLSKSFSVDNPKDIFPIFFNLINYKGSVPDIKYFKGINLIDYENYKKNFINKIWNFKEEAIKYCELDCISLSQILSKFNKLIFSKFSLNITNYPTLPSLAFSIFRSGYYKEEVIHQLSGQIDKDIRLGYTGGSTDMYIPKGNNIHVYDVNSLYPYVMEEFPYPIGTPTYFEGNILKAEKNAFGFFYVNVQTPNDLPHPILQIHHKTEGGIRTVSPLGKFSGWFFSEELYNAQKFGYEFEILRGYLFEKEYIFKDYVNDIYSLRLNYPKSDPMNYTAKILLNSLYGSCKARYG
jgi:DNA polymerase type B, organellar and viral